MRFFEKRDAVKAFFQTATPPETRHDWLDRYQVDFVVYGPEERLLGGFDPSTDPRLREVFRTTDLVMFQVAR